MLIRSYLDRLQAAHRASLRQNSEVIAIKPFDFSIGIFSAVFRSFSISKLEVSLVFN